MSKVTKNRLFKLLAQRHNNNPYLSLTDIPHPDNLKDIKRACERIKRAILNKEKITVVGDYDVDGVVSTTIVVEFFSEINIKIDYIIPNRFEHGYGLSSKIVDKIDSGLVITVDNGISANEAALKLKEKNIDLIITDHHTVGKNPPYAYAIINPKQEECEFEFKDICGAQVAWYLCAALKKELKVKINMGKYLDLLAVAIIADMMPMTTLNYLMVKKGLEKIKTSKREAFIKLNELLLKEQLYSDDIGFFIAPKLNSAGRIDDASLALEFLLSKTSYEANKSLFLLEELNNYRKVLQKETTEQAYKKVDKNDYASVVWDKSWHEGVIGIVASQLSHSLKKPAFVFSITNGIAKGSARANAKIDLYEIISKTSHLLLAYGGHKNAAGLSLDEKNLKEFKRIINLELKNYKNDLYLKPITLGELDIKSVDLEFLSIIEKFEPYGLENTKPVFTLENTTLIKSDLIGKDKSHLKLTLSNNGIIFEAIKFNDSNYKLPSKLDLLISVHKNDFRGEVSPQFIIQDIL